MSRSHCEMGEDREAVSGVGATGSTATSSTCLISTASSPSRSKRVRDPEDEVYLDSLHSHKRYSVRYHWILTIINEDKKYDIFIGLYGDRNRDYAWKTTVTK